jgi:hypothetical protein
MQRLGSVFVFAVLAADALSAQQGVLLEHEPTFDSEVRVLFQSVAQVVDAAGTTTEVADLGSFRGVALAGPNDEVVWHLTYDSLRVRTREVIGGWREFTVPNASDVWAQVHVDRSLNVSAVEQNQTTVGLTDPVGVLTGAPGLSLPLEALSRGDRWMAEMRGSLTGGLSGGGTVPDIPTLSVRSELSLDSLVERRHDTLAYLTLSGQIRPASIVRVTGEDPGRFNVSGDLVGNLVWSSGWSLFVSGATRVRVLLERTSENDPAVDMETITVVKTTRFQVQP